MAHLIDKDALVAEIDNLLDYANEHWDVEHVTGARRFADKLQDAINTLEVKEVDLDYIKKELDKLIKIHKPDGDFGWGTLYNVATHFFELGLKAKQE